MDVLITIKRLVISRRVLFTEKAEVEMARDVLTPELVYEAILNAPTIFKVLKKEGVDIFYVLISSKKSTDI